MEKLSEFVKKALDHSIAQTFLIFGGILTGVAFWRGNEGILLQIGLWTLFWGIIIHYLTSLRKHESLGRYAAGSDPQQIIRFSRTYITSFVAWATGTLVILLDFSNLIPLLNELFYISVFLYYLVLFITLGILSTPFILIAYWLWRMFENKKEAEKDLLGTYKLGVICRHCRFQFRGKHAITIPVKRPIWDHPCQRCGLYQLDLPVKEEFYSVKVICENCDNFFGEVIIPMGVSYKNFPCPNCGVSALKK